MMKTAFAATILAAAAIQLCSAQDGVVQHEAILSDTVKRGDMTIMVRALGTLTTSTTAELKVAETQAIQVQPGQNVSIDTRLVVIGGTVTRIEPGVVNGTVTVAVQLNAAPGAVPPAGTQVDGTIRISTLPDVVYVGRPVFGQAGSEATLFKLDPDGQFFSRVKVRFGRASVNVIQIVEGLQPGDRVILSDTSAYAQYNRLRLQ